MVALRRQTMGNFNMDFLCMVNKGDKEVLGMIYLVVFGLLSGVFLLGFWIGCGYSTLKALNDEI